MAFGGFRWARIEEEKKALLVGYLTCKLRGRSESEKNAMANKGQNVWYSRKLVVF